MIAAFLVTLAAMGRLLTELFVLAKKPDTRALLIWMVSLLLLGTVFYHYAEGWSWLDSIYFCVITLSTVGYGDLDPSTPESKIFTMAYIFMGLSVFVALVNTLAKARHDLQVAHREKRHHASTSPDKTADNQAPKSESTEEQS